MYETRDIEFLHKRHRYEHTDVTQISVAQMGPNMNFFAQQSGNQALNQHATLRLPSSQCVSLMTVR